MAMSLISFFAAFLTKKKRGLRGNYSQRNVEVGDSDPATRGASNDAGMEYAQDGTEHGTMEQWNSGTEPIKTSSQPVPHMAQRFDIF